MSEFPTALDTDIDLPRVDNNITDIGGDAINALRSAVFAIEAELGLGGSGTAGSVADRIGISLNPDGTLQSSAIAGLGLVTLPIFNSMIASAAAIDESKLNLTFSTQTLQNEILALENSVDVFNNFLSITGIKLAPHIDGSAFNHLLSAIDIDSTPLFYKLFPTLNVQTSGSSVITRPTANLNILLQDINTDLLAHEKADGTLNIQANVGGTVPPTGYAHNASGLFINSTNFSTIPQTVESVQEFAEFVDESSLLLLGTRTQTLYDNGVPVASRSISLVNDGYGEPIVPPTLVTAYLLGEPLSPPGTAPVDDIFHGDDIILFTPSTSVLSSNVFDTQFAGVSPGDVITIDYGGNLPIVQFTIDTVKSFINGSNRTYAVRINGKNLVGTASASARIDKPLFNINKYGVLAAAQANNNFNKLGSLVIGKPNSAQALGLGFKPEDFDANHYNIYLVLYPTGNPLDQITNLAPIDITGNKGATPGSYNIDNIVANANNAFRQNGYNFNFVAFNYNGNFGVMLADPYLNASFSIIGGGVDTNGNYSSGPSSAYPQNIVDNVNNIDPLGFGINGSNIATPAFAVAYPTPLAARVPTFIFAPLKRNFFYVNGVEKDNFAEEINTVFDGYADGYWSALISNVNILSDRVEVSYTVDLDLSDSKLQVGKTILVQPVFPVSDSRYSSVDYGRFIINNISFNNCPGPSGTTTITVYDGVHGTGNSPFLSSNNIPVGLYFSSDSVSFDAENASDPSSTSGYKRFFEIYVDQNGNSFSHERARLNITGSTITVDTPNAFRLLGPSELSFLNFVDVSPKLQGYTFSTYRKITLHINLYDATTGIYDGYMCRFDGSSYSNKGPDITGKKGEIVRFYDATNIDYIDFQFNIGDSVPAITSGKDIDIQLFPSLALNQEKILIASCQVNDLTKQVSLVNDKRQFGNTSENQLSNSAKDFIFAPERLLNENGIINGFDFISNTTSTFSINGGSALINGKIININDQTISLQPLIESISPSFTTTVPNITWFLCVNENSELEMIASTDFLVANQSTYGSLDQNRLFYVKNPLSSVAPYPIRATYLQNLILNYKDLAPLFIINTTVSGTSISTVSSIDIRRFISSGYNGLTHPFVLGNNESFRNINSLMGWINQLTGFVSYSNTNRNSIGNTIIIKDNFDLSSSTLTFASPVIFQGDAGAFTINNTNLSGNISFENCTFNCITQNGINIQGNDIHFDNCTFNYNYDATSDGGFNTSAISNNTHALIFCNTSNSNHTLLDFSVSNCSFTSSTINRYPFIVISVPGQTDYLENIHIDKNKFETLTSVTTEDILSVITVTSNYNVSVSGTAGIRAVNCTINNNQTNKDQAIIFSGSISGDIINTAITPVNVHIDNNVCGVICYFTRQDVPTITGNETQILDKNNMLYIQNNVCRYIFTGMNTGFISDGTSTMINLVASGHGIYSGSTIIVGNVCSWIQVALKSPNSYSEEIPTLNIANNKLNAFNSSFLTPYYNGLSVANTGILIESIVGT